MSSMRGMSVKSAGQFFENHAASVVASFQEGKLFITTPKGGQVLKFNPEARRPIRRSEARRALDMAWEPAH